MIEKQIADGIKKIRGIKGLTLKQLGLKTGISPGMLSRLENNQSSPPIATLAKIAQGLEVPISIFFEENGNTTDQKYTVTRNGQRRQVVRRGTDIGFIYYAFNAAKDLHLIEAFIMKHPPLKKKIKVLYDHPGEEFVLVLKGSIELIYGHETIPLAVGDAIHFDPSVPHRAQNVGKEMSECLVVIAGQKSNVKRNI
ncbi:MAG: DNA-binding transcriptional repressor PuuR [Smithella sp. PtaU1.Bin162]|jgi:transcriptional regulator with XRE-family HTH domain|nr:MAG: DNA-binding transcriptional repressor PuuR [Smithella sp. PtaU1.Bin162]